MTTLIEKAEAAYREAAQVDTAQAWRDAATLLFRVRRKPRASGGKFKGRHPAPVAVVTFSDGQTVRMSFWSQRGKPLDWDRAIRVCTSGYRLLNRPKPDGPQRGWKLSRLPLSAVPPIVGVHEATTGEIYDLGNAPGADQDQDRRKAA